MTLRYPQELVEGVTDYIKIETLEYRTNRRWGGDGQGGRNAIGDPARGTQPVILYMPNSTPPMGNPQTWQGKSFSGPLGELVGDAAVVGVNAAYELGGTLTDSGSIQSKATKIGEAGKGAIKTLMDTLKKNAGPAMGQGVTKAIAGFTPASENQLLALAKGEIYNPNIEMLYEGPRPRGFSLNFTFLPKSVAEAAVVNQIIRQFKMSASPSNDRGGNMFGVPHIFQVSYMMNGTIHPFMNRFRRTAMSDINITYNAGLPFHSTFDNGMPVKTDMTLSFLEVDIITREDHENANNQVGF